jgi:chaperonin GroEL (HSP60 family)
LSSERIITEGFDKAKEKAMEVLDQMKIELTEADKKEILTAVSR